MKSFSCLLLLFLIATLPLHGCKTVPVENKKLDERNPNAKPILVVIYAKHEYKESIFSARPKIHYTVLDERGHKSNVVSYDDHFEIGDCATLWRYIGDVSYPRISESKNDCTALEKEPENIGCCNSWFFPPFRNAEWRKYNLLMDVWVGLSAKDLEQVMGEPDEKLKSRDYEDWTYRKLIRDINGVKSPYSIPEESYDKKRQKCNSTFIIDAEGIIVGHRRSGSNCLDRNVNG
jgi:hypothetical protein